MAKMILIPLCLALAFVPGSFGKACGGYSSGCGGGSYTEEVRTVPASYAVKSVRYESVPVVSTPVRQSTSYYREYSSSPIIREVSPCRSGGCSSYTYERTVPAVSQPATVVREVSPCRSGGCSSYTYESSAPVVQEVVKTQPIVVEKVIQPQVERVVYSAPSYSYSSGCSTGRCGGSSRTYTSEYSSYSVPSYSSYSYSSPVVSSYSSGGCSGGCGKKK